MMSVVRDAMKFFAALFARIDVQAI